MQRRNAIGKVAIAIIVVILIAAVVAVTYIGLGVPGTPQGSTTQTSGGTGTGQMAVMATDPYSSAGGTKQYEHYNNVAAHKASGGGTSSSSSTTTSSSSGGWVLLNASGTLELDSIVNASQTVAVKNVAAGSYDSVRFYVDSSTVTYNGQNHTAQTGSSQITAKLNGNAQVSSGSTTAILFDMRTVVVNTASSSSPNFVVTSSARAEVVPSGSVSSSSLQVGAKTDLTTSAWFHSFVSGNAHLVIPAAAISSNSLSVTVKDTGSESSNASLVIVTPVSILGSATVVIPGALDGSAVFQVGSGDSLQTTSNIFTQLSSGTSATVTSYGSSTFTYSGAIQFGAGILAGVQTGQFYLITVIGNNSVASTTVVAS